jgi:RNA polymerase sigma factor (sigma-70 family)
MNKDLDFNIEFKNYEKEMRYLVKTWATDQHLRAYDLYEPEDILQEIYIAFWKALGDYNKGDVGVTFRTYWNRCVKNHMINLKDHSTRKVTGSTEEIVWQEGLDYVDEFEEAPDTLNPTDLTKDVNRALENVLSPSEVCIYDMYFRQGLTQQEISRITNTYRMDVSRAIEKIVNNQELRDRLTAYEGK